MNISNAIIEVTRMCNMACEHCLRGEPQKKEIPDEYLDTFFEKIESIGDLIITGGEPGLAPHKINAIVSYAKKHNVNIDNFYIATNGKYVSDEFMSAIINLYCYCSDNELSKVELSNDIYHEDVDATNYKKLSAFTFFGNRFDSHDDDYEPINEGRAKKNQLTYSNRTPERLSKYSDIDTYIYDDSINSEAEIYLNCKGNLIFGCDWSFRSQDSKKNIICHVSEFTIDKVYQYFEKRLNN